MRHNKLGDSVASEMDRLLSDASFNSVFSKPEIDVSKLVSQEPSYKAFVRVASKQEDSAALALQYIVESLAKTSEALDNMGLTKSATVALSLLNGVIKEASMKSFAQSVESEMKDRVDVMSPKEILSGIEGEEPKLPDFVKDTGEHLPVEGGGAEQLPVDGQKPDMLSDDDGEDAKRKALLDAMKGAVEGAPGTEQELKPWKSKHAPKSHDLIPTSTKRNPTDLSNADDGKSLLEKMREAVDSKPGTTQEIKEWKSKHAPKSHEQLPTNAPMLDRGKYERSKETLNADDGVPGTTQKLKPWESKHAPKSHEAPPTSAPMLDRGKYDRSKEKLNPPFKPAKASTTDKEVVALFNRVNEWVKKG